MVRFVLVAVAVRMVAVTMTRLGVALSAKHEKPDYRKAEKNLHHLFFPLFPHGSSSFSRLRFASPLVPAARRVADRGVVHLGIST